MSVTPHFLLEPQLTLDWVELPQGNFTARVISNRTTIPIAPRMFVAALIQYNSTARSLGTNIRYRWEYTPGSDLFIVYADGRDTAVPTFPRLLNRSVVVKYTRLIRF